MALTILLADDSLIAQNMGKKILSDAGYEIVAVSNGAAAMKKLTEAKPDIMLLDVYMPGYGGLEISEKVKSSPATAHIPVLLTVGKLEPFREEDGIKAKADGVIVKPFEATDLLAVVAQVAQRVLARQAQPTASAAPADASASTEYGAGPAAAAQPAPPVEVSSATDSAGSSVAGGWQSRAADWSAIPAAADWSLDPGVAPPTPSSGEATGTAIAAAGAEAWMEVAVPPATTAELPVELKFVLDAPGTETFLGSAPEFQSPLEPSPSVSAAPQPAPAAEVLTGSESSPHVPSAEVLAAIAGFDLIFEGRGRRGIVPSGLPDPVAQQPELDSGLEMFFTPSVALSPAQGNGFGASETPAASQDLNDSAVPPVPGSVSAPEESGPMVDLQLPSLAATESDEAGTIAAPTPATIPELADLNAVFEEEARNQADPATAATPAAAETWTAMLEWRPDSAAAAQDKETAVSASPDAESSLRTGAEVEWSVEPDTLTPWTELEAIGTSRPPASEMPPSASLTSLPQEVTAETPQPAEDQTPASAETAGSTLPPPSPAVAEQEAGPVLEDLSEPRIKLESEAEPELPIPLASEIQPLRAPGSLAAAMEADVLEVLTPENGILPEPLDSPAGTLEHPAAVAVESPAESAAAPPAAGTGPAPLTDAAAEQIVDRVLQRIVARVLENIRPELIEEVKRLLG